MTVRPIIARGCVLLLAVATARCGGTQRADESYRPQASGERGAGRILFDHGHQNFHRIDGRYEPFAELATSAGYSVSATERVLSADVLAEADLLVVANASAPYPGHPEATFAPEEIDAVNRYVRQGGGLLLITDMPPWSAPSAALASRFGVRLSGGVVIDAENSMAQASGALAFRRDRGMLGGHPILDGKTAAEQVNVVATFQGQSLQGPPGAVILLPFAPSAREMPLTATAKDSRYGVELQRTAGPKGPVAGPGQAIALEHGRGRVVVLGEAGMLSAQVTSGGMKMGMNAPGNDNRQFALNILRWLRHRL